jgi:four helix bundle protein
MKNEKLKIEEAAFGFASSIYKLCRHLKERREYVIGDQLLRSGTSIGANASEAQFASSKADFINKMSIALKEASETRYWLMILEDNDALPSEYHSLIASSSDLINILAKIVKTSKNNVRDAK